MARQLEFDRDEVLRRAMRVFWRKGFAATSTDDLLAAMGVGRQSMYNTFGDKRTLYLEALRSYQVSTYAAHLARLAEPSSAVEGIRQLLVGIAVDDDVVRSLGCLGVGSVGEFGATDAEISALRKAASVGFVNALRTRVSEGISAGELGSRLDAEAAVDYVLMTMDGLQIAARGGADAARMRRSAEFAVERLVAL